MLRIVGETSCFSFVQICLLLIALAVIQCEKHCDEETQVVDDLVQHPYPGLHPMFTRFFPKRRRPVHSLPLIPSLPVFELPSKRRPKKKSPKKTVCIDVPVQDYDKIKDLIKKKKAFLSMPALLEETTPTPINEEDLPYCDELEQTKGRKINKKKHSKHDDEHEGGRMNRIEGPKDKGDKFAEYDFSEFKAEEKVTERKVADKGDKNKKKADEKNSNATTTTTTTQTSTKSKAEPRLDTKKPSLKMIENDDKKNKTDKIKKKPKKWRLIRKRKQQNETNGTTYENMKVNSAFSWS